MDNLDQFLKKILPYSCLLNFFSCFTNQAILQMIIIYPTDDILNNKLYCRIILISMMIVYILICLRLKSRNMISNWNMFLSLFLSGQHNNFGLLISDQSSKIQYCGVKVFIEYSTTIIIDQYIQKHLYDQSSVIHKQNAFKPDNYF